MKQLLDYDKPIHSLGNRLDQAFSNISGAIAETGGCGSNITDHLPIWVRLPLHKKPGEVTIT